MFFKWWTTKFVWGFNWGRNAQIHKIWTIFDGFVAILAKKVVIFGTTLETTSFFENRHKTIKNRLITI